MNQALEVRKTPDGKVFARRKDGLPLSPEDREEARKMIQAEEDPLLFPDQWYPHFRDFHHKVIAETPDFDYVWLKENRPALHQAIKAKEKEIDALQEARLSQVTGIMREWRGLVLKVEFERRKNSHGR